MVKIHERFYSVHFVFCSFYSALSLCLGLVKHTMQLEGCFGALSVYVQVKINAPSILLLDVYKNFICAKLVHCIGDEAK